MTAPRTGMRVRGIFPFNMCISPGELALGESFSLEIAQTGADVGHAWNTGRFIWG